MSDAGGAATVPPLARGSGGFYGVYNDAARQLGRAQGVMGGAILNGWEKLNDGFWRAVGSGEIVKGIQAEDGSFVNPSFYYGSGFAGGAALGQGVQDGYRKNLQIASPSRVFERLGDLTGQGLVVGLLGEIPATVAAARSMAEAATGEIQAMSARNAGATLGQSLAEGIRSEVASVVEATRMLTDEATAAAMVRMEEVRREALRSGVTVGTTGTTATAPASVQATAPAAAVGGRTTTIAPGAVQVSVSVNGAEMGDPQTFATRLREPIIAAIAEALERQSDLGAGDGLGL